MIVDTKKRYAYGTDENREFLNKGAERLLEFGRRFPAPDGSSYYLLGDGTPDRDHPRETWITSRMVHVYSVASTRESSRERATGYKELAAAGLKGLTGALHDDTNGGWYAGIGPDGVTLPGKHCYAHAFVILAASSACRAGIVGAKELLDDALRVYDSFFWDEEEGLSRDNWDTAFSVCDDYRGLNAVMHTVEAFLAASKIEGHDHLRKRAGRIIERVIGFARENDFRLPEHYTREWVPDLDVNRDRPDDPFKPYGATPGHGIEWARLIAEYAQTSVVDRKKLTDEAESLYKRAVADAWNVDGAEGIVYTTDWDGTPVVHDRMHWTLAEAINTSVTLLGITGREGYARDYAAFLEYLDEKVLDHSTGSWYHQLDRSNRLLETVWPGKPDIYHAYQAMIIPYGPLFI